MVVTELAVITFGEGHPVLVERAPGVPVSQIVEKTQAVLAVPDHVPEMTL
jgi:acyl CoA:acetate/3-ketoacid CoA transferase beta subunit